MEESTHTCKICGVPRKRVDSVVQVCSSCKSFYQRSVAQKSTYKCFLGEKCSTEVDGTDVPRCKACRFRKYISLAKTAKGRALPASRRPTSRGKSSVTEDRKPKQEKGSFAYTQNDYTVYTPEDQRLPRPTSSSGSVNSGVISPFTDVSSDELFDPITKDVLSSKCLSQSIPFTNIPLDASKNSMCLLNFGRQLSPFDESKRHVISTVFTVASVVQDIFTDHSNFFSHLIGKRQFWTHDPLNQASLSRDELIMVMNQNSFHFIVTLQKFITHLPGAGSRPDEQTKRCFWASWKVLVLNMIHWSMLPPNPHEETLIVTNGSPPIECMSLRELFNDWPIIRFMKIFHDKLKAIGLDATESCFLMAVVIFEPVDEGNSEHNYKLKLLHHHYCDVLMDVLRRRCSDHAQLAALMSQLGELFCLMQVAQKFCGQKMRQFPRSATEAHITIIEAEVSSAMQTYMEKIVDIKYCFDLSTTI